MPSKVMKPIINDIPLLNIIVNERQDGKNATFFTSYESTWINRYQEYISNNGNPEIISRSIINEADSKKFIGLYKDKPQSILSQIIEPLNNHKLTYCPFCSEAGKPNTLDHFLPKSNYSEYSILSDNLVPACDFCQRSDAKGIKVLNAHRKRFFLHPYFDIPDDIPLIFLIILPPYDKGYKYKLIINKSLSPDLKRLIRRHINELQIYRRFNEFYSGEFVRKRDLIKEVIVNNEDLLTRKLTLSEIKRQVAIFYEKEKKISINYWDAVIYKGFLENDNLLDYISNNIFY